MKKILVLFFLSSVTSLAQTSLTGTVQDTAGQLWAGGTYSISLYNPSQGQRPIDITTGQPIQTNYSGTINSSGQITLALTNSTNIYPSGTLWQVTLCPNASAVCQTLNHFSWPVTLQSGVIFAPSPVVIPAAQSMYGYSLSEISGIPNLGSIFLNVSTGISCIYTASGNCNQMQVGVVPISQGGSGQTTPNAAMTAFGITQSGSGSSQVDAFPGSIITPVFNKIIYLQNSSDIGAQINAAVAALGSTGGDIILPLGVSTISTTATIPYATISITGYGPLASQLNCTVSGDCLVIDCSSSACHATTYGASAVFSGFSIVGNGAAGQNIIHTKDIIGFDFHDLDLDGASESGGACFKVEDTNYWSERNKINHVNFRYGCNSAVVLYPNPADPYCLSSAPSNQCSFGYNDIEFSANPGSGQTALSMNGQGILYDGNLKFIANVSGSSASPATIIYGSGNFQVDRELLDANAEENGTGDIAWSISGLTSSWVFGGHAYFDSFASNYPGGVYGSNLTITEGGWGTDYTQQTYIPPSGIYYDFHAGNSFLIPQYSAANYAGGIGYNGRFQYSSGNFICLGDGTHNGCGFSLLNNTDSSVRYYSVPNTGSSNQSITPANIGAYQVGVMNQNGFNNSAINVNTGTGSSATWNLIAQLPVVSGSTLDEAFIQSCGGQWAYPKGCVDVLLSNRGGFTYNYEFYGQYTTSFGIQAYQSGGTSGVVNIYAYLPSGTNMSQTTSALVGGGALSFTNSAATTTTPSGTLVFDSTNTSTYPPNRNLYIGSLFLDGSPVSAANTTGAAIVPVTIGASPFTYSFTTRGQLCLSGGAPTLIDIIRSGTTVDTGQTQGCFYGLNGDSVEITYTGTPTLNFIPE